MQHAVTRIAAGRASRSWLDVAWLAVCVVGFLALCWLNRRFLTDDAWITARYAENLADGHGFVFNPGGPRTEGFSNPLLVAVEALLHPLGLSAIATAQAVGVASGVGLLVVLHRLGPAVVGQRATRVALAITAFYPPMALWAVGGLETMPTALAVTTGVLLLARGAERDALRAGAVFALLPWLRPEGLVVALAAIAAVEGLPVLRRQGRGDALRRLAVAASLPLAAQAVLEAIRLIVYGHWLPNSVVYKGETNDAYAVLERFVDQSSPILLVAAAGCLLCRGRARVLAVPPAVYLIGSVGVLDSVNSFSRFLLPIWPQLALLAGVAVAVAIRPLGRVAVPIAAAAALLATFVVFTEKADFRTVRAFASDYAKCPQAARRDAADWLRANTVPGTVYSVSDSGLIPARGGGRQAIDQFMLNEALIQQTGPVELPLRADVVFGREPDVVVLASTRSDRFAGAYPIDRRLARDPRFGRYRVVHVARGRSVGCAYHLFVYRRAGAPAQQLAYRRGLRPH